MAEIRRYISTDSCLMEFLARALDDSHAHPCGRCARCLGRPIVPEGYSQQRAILASRFLRQAEFPLQCSVQIPTDALTAYGLRGNMPRDLRAEEGRVLSRWGDAGWGQLVADDKHAGRFRDELVEALAEMISERWRPSPLPTWVTCVPSRNHPELVPDFALRLANRLGLEFAPCVVKVRDNPPQNQQHNRYHQCRNLDGVFAIEGDIAPEPVLLVDDNVDSTWTMTVISALLRRSGSGPVFPVALASTRAGG